MNRIPLWHKIRWQLAIQKNRIHIRTGLFMMELCYNHIQPRYDSVNMDERVDGAWIAFFPVGVVCGQTFKIYGWKKTKTIGEYLCQK